MNNTIPNNKSPPNAFYKTLKSISLLAVGSIIGYSASQYSSHQNRHCSFENKPIETENTVSNDTSCPKFTRITEPDIIVYSDNNAVGMNAFAENKTKSVSLVKGAVGKMEALFIIPQNEFNEKDTLKVYAIDRYGKRSKTRIIYELEGTISESPFP